MFSLRNMYVFYKTHKTYTLHFTQETPMKPRVFAEIRDFVFLSTNYTNYTNLFDLYDCSLSRQEDATLYADEQGIVLQTLFCV